MAKTKIWTSPSVSAHFHDTPHAIKIREWTSIPGIKTKMVTPRLQRPVSMRMTLQTVALMAFIKVMMTSSRTGWIILPNKLQIWLEIILKTWAKSSQYRNISLRWSLKLPLITTMKKSLNQKKLPWLWLKDPVWSNVTRKSPCQWVSEDLSPQIKRNKRN